MKHISLTLLAILILGSYSLHAETKKYLAPEIQSKISEKINTISQEEFLNKHRRIHSRIPDFREKLNFPKFNSEKNKSFQNEPIVQSNDSLLNKAIFPGEFDEVKAILIACPYVTFDTTGEITEQIFDGVGVYYDTTSKQYVLGPVYSLVDTFAISPFPVIFSKLASGISQHAEVWINVWYPEDSSTVLNYMNKIGLPLTNYKFFVHPGNSFWYRDSGPMAFYYGENDDLAFLDMEYYGGRPLDDSIPQLIAKDLNIPLVKTTIEFEGGNVLLDGEGNLFTSDAVYYPNSDVYGQYYMDENGDILETQKKSLTKPQVNDSLKRILNLNSLKVLPALRYDGGTGHIDLYADLLDENSFVFSKMPEAMSNFTDYSIIRKNVDTILSVFKYDKTRYTGRNIPFPKKDNGSWYSNNNDYFNYTRTYSNHTFVNDAIIQPVFANEKTGDKASMSADLDSIQAKYPGYTIIPIDVRAFDGFGGAIHCITKQIPADNPILIYHHPYPNGERTRQEFPVTARIRNKSGIASAKIYYRLKGNSDWTEANLINNNDGTFTYSIQNSEENGIYEYYFEATSNNGKTVKKPITSPLALYSFNFKQDGVSVNESLEGSIGNFYPNPASSEVRLTFNSDNDYLNIQILDQNGKIVSSNELTHLSSTDEIIINTNSLPNGVYFVKFTKSDGQKILRYFVVKK